MKKFILEIDSDEITKFGIENTLEDYFGSLYMDGEIDEEPIYKLDEIIEL